jgi:hypothetical protein
MPIIRNSIKLYSQHLGLTNGVCPAVIVDESELVAVYGGCIPHRPFVNPRCCEYSLIELLMMGMGYARNMYSDLQEIIKYCTNCHLVGTFFKLIHDARNDKHKI